MKLPNQKHPCKETLQSWQFLKRCSQHDVKTYLKIKLPQSEAELALLTETDHAKIREAAHQLDLAYSV